MSKYLKLLTEFHAPQNFKTIIEESDTSKPRNYYIVGPMIVTDQRNNNGRIYKKQIIEREINTSFLSLVAENRAAGELGHPQSPDINLDRISHYITELVQDNNVWIGKAKVASTPCGEIVKALLNDGYKLGMSTRGLGDVDSYGDVNDDFQLITIDIVSDPSAPGCFVQGILENKNYLINAQGKIMESAIDNLKESVEKRPKKDVELYLSKAIKQFLKELWW